MKRCWKVGIALAVVGLAGFLVWAFRTPVTPPLTIRFVGFATNNCAHCLFVMPPHDRVISAVFAVTNHSTRWMAVEGSFWLGTDLSHAGATADWLDAINSAATLTAGIRLFKPGEGALIGAATGGIDERVLLSIRGRFFLRANTFADRFEGWMPWNKRKFSASATNELR